MIQFNFLEVDRLIIHIINAKKTGQDSAIVEYSEDLSLLDQKGKELIKERLTNATGRDSKSFELKIENQSDGSFIQLIKGLNFLDKTEFINISKQLADLLADSQKSTRIPGGYFILLSCHDSRNKLPINIVIKAEPHEALQFSHLDGQDVVNVLQKVFLSPSQKLFKIGIVYQKNDSENTNINEKFGCLIYDEQFRTESHPAEYFYKDFLGFSTDENAKIQTQRFFDKTASFIIKNIGDIQKKNELLSALKVSLIVNNSSTLSPKEFADQYFNFDQSLLDKYKRVVCNEIPISFVKDSILIKSKLSNRKILFKNRINLIGPEDVFDNNVIILNKQEDLKNLSVNNAEYTIIKILGKPYTADE